MTLNGQPYFLNGLVSIGELLGRAGFDLERVAVLLNGEIVARDAFEKTEIDGEDALEVLFFVGGG